MKMLLSTTALVVALGFPAMSLAQTVGNDANSAAGPKTPGFLVNRGQSDIFASELMGHDVHARRTPGDPDGTGARGATNMDRTFDMATMTRAELDDMDSIGKITEIVLSSDGQVRAIVIGVGGFLGMGEQDVAVTIDQVTFASDTDDPSQIYVVVNTGTDRLKTSPAYDRMAMMQGQPVSSGGATLGASGAQSDNGDLFAAPSITRDGYTPVEAAKVTSDLLVGKAVFGVNDGEVGTIQDLVLDAKGSVSDVIIDFGGFLGMGVNHVAVGFDELTILGNEGYADVRVYVDATKEQVQARERYTGGN